MEKEWPNPVGDNRLTRYNIAEWLRMLVAMRLMGRGDAAESAWAIRRRIESGQAPWPKES
jgi:hypothetical protein